MKKQPSNKVIGGSQCGCHLQSLLESSPHVCDIELRMRFSPTFKISDHHIRSHVVRKGSMKKRGWKCRNETGKNEVGAIQPTLEMFIDGGKIY